MQGLACECFLKNASDENQSGLFIQEILLKLAVQAPVFTAKKRIFFLNIFVWFSSANI